MSIGSRIAWDDAVLPFQLDRTGIRGRVVRLDRTLTEILENHRYPDPVAALVAEASLLTALIGSSIKLRWRLSLQLRGDGPVRLVATDYRAPDEAGEPALIRACASFDPEAIDPLMDPRDLMGEGYFSIIIDQGRGTTPYQGVTPIAGRTLAAAAASYFAQSEQLPTHFALAWRKEEDEGSTLWRGGGIMIQQLPRGEMRTPEAGGSGERGLLRPEDFLGEEDQEDWNRTCILLDTVAEDELLGDEVQPTELLVRLFHEETPRVFDPIPVRFGCSCSEDKVRQALSGASSEERASMTTEAGVITADCQFCGARYEIDPASLESATDEAGPDQG